MKNLFLALTVSLISLTSFAQVCESEDPNCAFVAKAAGTTEASTNAVGFECPGCRQLELAYGKKDKSVLKASDAEMIATPGASSVETPTPSSDVKTRN